MTMPETWVPWSLAGRGRCRSGRPWPSRPRAGASRPSVSTSESSTSSTVGRDVGVDAVAQAAQQGLAAAALGREPLAAGAVAEVADVRAASRSRASPRRGRGRRRRRRSGRPGRVWMAAWQSRLRATASAPSRSPTMPTTPGVGEVDLDRRGRDPGRRRRPRAPRRSSLVPAEVSSGGFHGTLPTPACSARKLAGARPPLPQLRGRQRRAAHHGRGVGDLVATAGRARPSAASSRSSRKPSSASAKRSSSSSMSFLRRRFCSHHGADGDDRAQQREHGHPRPASPPP